MDEQARQSTAALADLPDDVRALLEPHMAEDQDTLDAIGLAIAHKRDDAKTARQASGIETTWTECEEAYVGIDEANRGEFQGGRWAKPLSPTGPVTTTRTPRNPDHRSTAFVRLTARYVDAGAAKLGEILLPADDKAFSFSEMPVPELIRAKDDTSQVVHNGVPLTRPAQPGEMPPPGPGGPPAVGASPLSQPAAAAPGVPAPPVAPVLGAPPVPATAAPGQPPAAPPQVPITVRDFALEKIEIARKKAKAAEARIYDWMVACQYQGQVRKVIFDAARIGVGVLKAPYPKASRQVAVFTSKDGGIDIAIREEVTPAAAWVDPWNIYPDPACGENIHEGDYIFECDFMAERQIRDLMQIPGYIKDQIEKVLKEGPEKAYANEDGSAKARSEARTKGRYQVWYFYGMLKREEMAALNKAAALPSDPSDKDQVYAIVTLVNDRVVRATINPLDSGSFPYHSMPWQRRAGHWAGIGVAEQLKMPQRTVNAATRAMLNNAGKSAGSQIVVDRSVIIPADNNWTMTPDKVWYTTAEGVGTNVHNGFMAVEIPNMTPQLMQVIQYAMQLAEESTSIPLVTQGQSGETTPETFGATQLQNNNANQLLRSIGYAFDDFITEPVVLQWYEWLLLDPDVPNDEKGDFRVNAHGSIALVERAIQDQTIAQMGPMAANPIYGLDPKKWATEFVRSHKLDPANFKYTEEEQAKLDANPAEAPVVTVAKIGADTAMKQLAAKQTVDQQSQASEERIAEAARTLEGSHVQNDAQRIAAESQRTQVEATIKLHEIQLRHDLAMLDYANRNHVSLTQAKVELAKTSMQLQTEKELNEANNAAGERKHRREMQNKPPVQAPGRAGKGHAFDQAR